MEAVSKQNIEYMRHPEVEEGIRVVEAYAYVPKRIKSMQSVGLNPIAHDIAHNMLLHFLFSWMGHSCVKTLHKTSYIN